MAGIRNAHLLTDVFGYWPSFHDAEVHSVLLGRDPEHYATLDAKVHVHEMTGEVDKEGYFVLRHHTLVHLRFQGLADLEACDFNHQNVLFGLKIKDISAEGNPVAFDVDFDATYGFGATFKCQKVSVVSAEAYQVHSPAHNSSAPEGLSVAEE